MIQRMQVVSHDEFKAMRRFPAFDGLRAVAAVLVFTFHFGGSGWQWASGWIGVHLFFVLSGFLITTLLLREEERYGRISLRGFYVRRVFRIMPVYVVVLLVTYALAHVTGTGQEVRRSLWHYLLLLNEFAPTNAFLHSWTIGIEQKFYLFWPVIAFALTVGAVRRRLLVTVAAIGCLAAFIPTAKAFPFWPIHYIVILIGCLLAIVMHHPRGYAIVRPLTHPLVATAVGIGFVGVHLGITAWPPAADGHSESLLAFYGVVVAVLLPTLLSRGLPAKLLSLRPLVFVGERSYSLYLVQILAAKAVAGLMPAYARPGSKHLVAGLIIGLLAADLLYRWVELPMINLGRRFAPRSREPYHEVLSTGPAAEPPRQRQPVASPAHTTPPPDPHPTVDAVVRS
jgi:peptidoglycan/LPS O-acetylase OafA/YrhL